MTEGNSINNSRLIPSMVITSILAIATTLSFIHTKTILTVTNILVMLGHFVAIIYAAFSKELIRQDKTIILIISILPLLFYLFMINHWPGILILRLIMFIPIGTFIYVSFRVMNRLKYEFPFLGLMAIYILLMIL